MITVRHEDEESAVRSNYWRRVADDVRIPTSMQAVDHSQITPRIAVVIARLDYYIVPVVVGTAVLPSF